jgi:hypothetical protein
MPPEMPVGANPPSGAILDYTLHAAPSQPIELAIYDANGNLVRQFSSAPVPESVRRPEKWPTIADYWMADPQPLATHIGMNRFVWDLRYSPPRSTGHSYPMSAVPHETPAGPEGPLVVPGKYVVKLTVDGQIYRQPLTVRPDPREAAPPSAYAAQLSLEQKIMAGMRDSYQAYEAAKQHGDDATAGQFAELNGTLSGLAIDIEGADAAPTSAMNDAVSRELEQLTKRLHGSK